MSWVLLHVVDIDWLRETNFNIATQLRVVHGALLSLNVLYKSSDCLSFYVGSAVCTYNFNGKKKTQTNLVLNEVDPKLSSNPNLKTWELLFFPTYKALLFKAQATPCVLQTNAPFTGTVNSRKKERKMFIHEIFVIAFNISSEFCCSTFSLLCCCSVGV
jgi:hypothetical protein